MEPPLTETEHAVLLEALDDEYQAWATYDQVVRDHGAIRPFTNIRAAEARHAEALAGLLRAGGAPVPPNPWIGSAPRFASVAAACEAAVAAEIENAALYERLLSQPVRAEIRAVLLNLQRASQERHLPAFRRCAARDRGTGSGRGDGPCGGPGARGRHGRLHRGG